MWIGALLLLIFAVVVNAVYNPVGFNPVDYSNDGDFNIGVVVRVHMYRLASINPYQQIKTIHSSSTPFSNSPTPFLSIHPGRLTIIII